MIRGQAHKNVFDKVFDTLQNGLSKLGESSSAQTKAIKRLLHLIAKIPMDGRQDYDVLGFIYEYLIGMFAANAGKNVRFRLASHQYRQIRVEIHFR